MCAVWDAVRGGQRVRAADGRCVCGVCVARSSGVNNGPAGVCVPAGAVSPPGAVVVCTGTERGTVVWVSRIVVVAAAAVSLAGCVDVEHQGDGVTAVSSAAPVVLRADGRPAAHPSTPIGHQDRTTRTVRWPMDGETVHEEHPLFDCRVDGDQHCGPTATVPVPDGDPTSVRGEHWQYVPLSAAPWPPLWRQYAR